MLSKGFLEAVQLTNVIGVIKMTDFGMLIL